MRSAIKYQDKHKNGVIFVTSDSYFSTLFLQKKRQVESSGFRSNHNVSPYNYSFTFTGKEWCKSQWPAQRGLERGISETGYSYFGARFYDSDLSGLFTSVDPMADKYSSNSPYAYCMWNPLKLTDPNGMDVGNPPKSRITVQNGYVVLNMDNLHNNTRNRLYTFNNDTRNWPKGSIGAIPPLAHIEYGTPELLDPQGGYGYSKPSNHIVRTKAITAESTGLPDRRVKPRVIASSGSKGMNLALVVIDATIYIKFCCVFFME